MKTFNSAYRNSKKILNEQTHQMIEGQHVALVESIKRTYAIDSFNNLTELERKSYRTMIQSMWNKESGLNEDGWAFINESKEILTPDSTDEQIEKYFLKCATPIVREYLNTNITYSKMQERMCECKRNMERRLEHRLNESEVKEWLLDLIKYESDSLVRKIKLV